jgi:uncharacterized protein YdeI (YjbR/CyaY-like superfamily)
MLEVLKKVNFIYPLDLKTDQLKSKKEVVETLLAEINQVRNIDEQEEIILDKNDLECVTLNEDLSIKVGVRSFIPDPEYLTVDKDKYLLDFNPGNQRSLDVAEAHVTHILQLRKELRAKAKEAGMREEAAGLMPLKIHQDETVHIPYSSGNDEDGVEVVDTNIIQIDEED